MKLNFCPRRLKHIKTIFLRLSKVASFFPLQKLNSFLVRFRFCEQLLWLFFYPRLALQQNVCLNFKKQIKIYCPRKRIVYVMNEWLCFPNEWVCWRKRREYFRQNFSVRRKGKTRGSFTRREREIHMSRCLSIFCRMFEQRYRVFC